MVFGKTTDGSTYWDIRWGTKIGTLYHTDGETVDLIVARFTNAYAGIHPVVKACMYDAEGNLLAISLNEVQTQPADERQFKRFQFQIPSVSLPFGDFRLVLHVGESGALRASYDANPTVKSALQNDDDYEDGPSDPFDASSPNPPTELYKDFDIYATLAGETQPPKAAFTHTVPVIVNEVAVFDGGLSTPGWTGYESSPLVDWLWDFGDGGTGSGMTYSHKYTARGSYDVTLTVTDGQGLTDSITTTVYVTTRIEARTIRVDFEDDRGFEVGVSGKPEFVKYPDYIKVDGLPSYWDFGGYAIERFPTDFKFEPETTIVHSGERSARMALLNPVDDGRRRLEILRAFDPAESEHLWDEAWFYLPSALRPFDSWIVFHRAAYERMWDASKAVYFQYFQLSISMVTDGRSATLGDQIFVLNTGKGNVDNDNNGVTEEWPYMGADLYSNVGSSRVVPEDWLTRAHGLVVPFDRWFKMQTHVYRNFDDFDNGAIRVRIDDKLVWDIQGIRTIGIDPYILRSVPMTPPDPQGWFSAGFGIYTAVGSAPKTMYIDDVMLSLEATPTPIPPLAVVLAAGIPVAVILWWLLK